MTMPSQPHPDDSWAELYTELGLEPETVAPNAVAEEPVLEPEYGAEAEESEESEEFGDSLESSEGENDAEGESESPEGEASDENDPNKKKRRRRRRRRGGKKDDGTEAGAAAEGEEAEEGETAVAVLDEEDGPGPEAAQQLIANWDVPSWGEIVAGLFRPGNNSR